MQFQFSAALAIVLGWLLTATAAREFVQRHASISRLGAVVLCGTLVLFHISWVHLHYQRSVNVYNELRDFGNRVFPEGRMFIESLSIDRFLPWSYLTINLLTCGAIVTVTWLLG
jgi:hypothetical protein